MLLGTATSRHSKGVIGHLCSLSLHLDYFSIGLTQRSLPQQLWVHMTLHTEDGRVEEGESLFAEGHNKAVGEVADGPVLGHMYTSRWEGWMIGAM